MVVQSSPSAAPVYRSTTTAWLLLAVALVLSIWPFLGSLTFLWETWTTVSEYSHGLLMPLITAYLIWCRKDKLATIPFDGSWFGPVLVVVAAAVYWVGVRSTLHIVDNVGFLLLIDGLILSLLGARAFRLVLVPLLLLILAIPLPNFFLNNLSATLQLWSSELGVAFIRAFGISVLLQGNVIDLGLYRLEVAEACSGLRYLFPLVTVGVLMGYLYHGAFWKRLLIAVVSLPLTLLMNSLRIGTIGVMVDKWGPSLAEGFVHDLQGWAMFMVSSALMLGLLVFLHRLDPNRASWQDAFGLPAFERRNTSVVAQTVPTPRSLVVAASLVLAIAVAGEVLPAPKERIVAREAFTGFPAQIGAWRGHPVAMDAASLDVLQLDDYLLSNYESSDGTVINLYVNYYKAQHSSQAVHSPRSCLPGGGWIMKSFEQRVLPSVAIAGKPVTVNRAIIEQGNERQLVYYWFQQRGRNMTNEYTVKWFLLRDSLVSGRTDGGLVRLVIPLPVHASEAEGDARLEKFAGQIAPLLPEFIPN